MSPLYTVTKALLAYKPVDGKELQVLTFHGMSQSGEPFVYATEPHDPNDDPVIAAQVAADAFLAR